MRFVASSARALGLFLLVGCDSTGIVLPEADGSVPEDASSVTADGGVDAGPDSGPPVECRADSECEDGDPCTDHWCQTGLCHAQRSPACRTCAGDADCDDGSRCSTESCVAGYCSYEWSGECECLEDAHCDDGDPSTTERCVDSMCIRSARTCTAHTDCEDGDGCTIDECVSGSCTRTPNPRCSGCPDNDGDGHGSRWCIGGDDCDDANGAIHPGATEVCTDTIDNDCDGAVDYVDSACELGGGATCATAVAATPGTTMTGAIRTTGSGPTGSGTPCGASQFYTLALARTSDVTVTITLAEPPPPTPVPGCPECTPDEMWEYHYRVFLERTCGDPATDLNGSGGYCTYWSRGAGPFPGAQSVSYTLRRVAAGTYGVEVQASDMFGWMPRAIRYDLDIDVTPSASADCSSATMLAEGVTSSATTGTNDAFGLACNGTATASPETLSSFTLAERRRVRLEIAGTPDPMGNVPGMRLGVYGSCDPDATRTHCLEQSGYSCHTASTLETVLDAGTYTVVTEGRDGLAASYGLTLRTAAIGAACEGATPIAASGSFSGTTTGSQDRFRDERICGDAYAPDVVYELRVAERSRVVLDLIASYTSSQLTLYTGCGESRAAGGNGRSRIDTTLEPGTYYAVVDGQRAESHGSYILNATVIASPATP